MAGQKNLRFYFQESSSSSSSSSPSASLEDEVPDHNLLSIEEAIDRLEEETSIGKSIDDNDKIEPYQLLRFLTLKVYFRMLLDGEKKMDASLSVATEFWKGKPYRATRIRQWDDEFLLTGDLAHHQQGTHAKISALKDDEDFSSQCISWLRAQKPEERSPLLLKQHVESEILPKLSNVRTTISETTCREYMKEWGWRFGAHHKDVYTDGHEREDVVAYRDSFVERMKTREGRMSYFEGENMIEVEPLLEDGERKIVLVTQDESTFHAHDARNRMWKKEGEQILRKKGPGKGLMVSNFMCPCHGTVCYQDFEFGKNSQGYWTNSHMQDQLKLAVRLFEEMHPSCQGLFIFDQSSNHGALSEDALRATTMNLGPGGKQPKMRDGYFFER